MDALTDTSSASMQFTISWQSDNVMHKNHYLADDVNMWRDIFPDSIRQKLIGMIAGDTINHSLFSYEIINNNHATPLSLPLSCWQELDMYWFNHHAKIGNGMVVLSTKLVNNKPEALTHFLDSHP